MCVGSNGIVASRRKIILRHPTNKDIQKTKFCGLPLGDYIQNCLENVSKIKKYICNKIANMHEAMDSASSFAVCQKLDKEMDVYVYGEWIHRNCQTSDSNVDKYNYKQRGLVPGHLYAFGFSIVLRCEPTSHVNSNPIDLDALMELVSKVSYEGKNENTFLVRKISDIQDNPFLVVLLSNPLKTFLNGFKFETVPILGETQSVEEGILTFASQLHHPSINFEGIVFTGHDLVKAVKLKNLNAEGRNPLNLENYQRLELYIRKTKDKRSTCEKCKKNTELLFSIIRGIVGYGSTCPSNIQTEINQSTSCSYILNSQFQRAYESARTKYPYMTDCYETEESVQKMEGYKNSLKCEMLRDLKSSFKNNVDCTDFYTNYGKHLDRFLNDIILQEKR